ncbi:MAG: hypothetical protein NC121_03515 [Blautia sp.]|nr:hypothetical protein [Blautia sp.]
MKFVKSISLYFIYPMAMLCIGFYGGVVSSHFFYPGEQIHENGEVYEAAPQDGMMGEPLEAPDDLDYRAEDEAQEGLIYPDEELLLEAAAVSETLSADTEYVLEETNILDQSVVRTTWRLPRQYMGMNRDQFLETMELYAAHPPLSEKERGFVGLEVLSFSRERVVVRMDYRYVQPSASFYLAVYDNEVVVYLEDKRTIYINTEIPLDSLPERVQQEIIEMMWMPDEESLYRFLESYSS